jgi:hypothetical protein
MVAGPELGETPVLDDLAYDDSDEPGIGLVPGDVPWDAVQDHIKIVHGPLLVGPDASGQYAGAYWASTEMVVESDLGSDQDEAVTEFRQLLRERGQV